MKRAHICFFYCNLIAWCAYVSEKKGADYRCLFISFIWYRHICTVGVNIKTTHAVHLSFFLSISIHTYDRNYRAFTTFKIRINICICYDLNKYYIKVEKKGNCLSVQCHLISSYLTAYRIVKSIKRKQKNIYIHIHQCTCKRNKILKTSRWIVYVYTLSTSILYSHTHSHTYQVISYIRMSKHLTYDNDNIKKNSTFFFST